MDSDFVVNIKLPGSDEIVKEFVSTGDSVSAVISVAMKYNQQGVTPEIVKVEVAAKGPQAHA